MTDLITIGETMAVFTPKISGPLRYIHDYTTCCAGAESNTAIGLQKLGHTTKWFSRIGNDELGQYVLNTIRAEGVDTSAVIKDDNHSTGLMIKEFRTPNDTNVYYYRNNSAASHMNPNDLTDELICDAKILHLTGITPILSSSCMELTKKSIEIAKNNNVKISFDPNIRLKLWGNKDYIPLIMDILMTSNIVMLGLSEAEHLFKTNQIDRIIEMLFQSDTIEYIAIKNGDKGAHIATRYETIYIPPFPCTCVDPIGAGDAFNAGFLAGILEGRDLQSCGNIAGIVGALATQTTGDIEGLPTMEEVLAYIENKPKTNR
ncbi:MAG: sugar kinase [Clostridiales bacterium]|nr:sugar kinase [Clostridiales bacterium]